MSKDFLQAWESGLGLVRKAQEASTTAGITPRDMDSLTAMLKRLHTATNSSKKTWVKLIRDLQAPKRLAAAVCTAPDQFGLLQVTSVALLLHLLMAAKETGMLGNALFLTNTASCSRSSSNSGSSSQYKASGIIDQLQEAGFLNHIPRLMQSLTAHLGSMQDSNALLLAAGGTLSRQAVNILQSAGRGAQVPALLLHTGSLLGLVVVSQVVQSQPRNDAAFTHPALQLSLSVMRFVSRCVDQLPAQHADAPAHLHYLWERAVTVAYPVMLTAQGAFTRPAHGRSRPNGSGVAQGLMPAGAAALQAAAALPAACMLALHTMYPAPSAAKLAAAESSSGAATPSSSSGSSSSSSSSRRSDVHTLPTSALASVVGPFASVGPAVGSHRAAWAYACQHHTRLPQQQQKLLRLLGCSSRALVYAVAAASPEVKECYEKLGGDAEVYEVLVQHDLTRFALLQQHQLPNAGQLQEQRQLHAGMAVMLLKHAAKLKINPSPTGTTTTSSSSSSSSSKSSAESVARSLSHALSVTFQAVALLQLMWNMSITDPDASPAAAAAAATAAASDAPDVSTVPFASEAGTQWAPTLSSFSDGPNEMAVLLTQLLELSGSAADKLLAVVQQVSHTAAVLGLPSSSSSSSSSSGDAAVADVSLALLHLTRAHNGLLAAAHSISAQDVSRTDQQSTPSGRSAAVLDTPQQQQQQQQQGAAIPSSDIMAALRTACTSHMYKVTSLQELCLRKFNNMLFSTNDYAPTGVLSACQPSADVAHAAAAAAAATSGSRRSDQQGPEQCLQGLCISFSKALLSPYESQPMMPTLQLQDAVTAGVRNICCVADPFLTAPTVSSSSSSSTGSSSSANVNSSSSSGSSSADSITTGDGIGAGLGADSGASVLLQCLPWLVVLGRCCLVIAHQAQWGLLQTSASDTNLPACLVHCQELLQDSTVSAQLAAAGYSTQHLLPLLQAAADAVTELEVPAASAAAIATAQHFRQGLGMKELSRTLEELGLALNTIPIDCACNNPYCSNMSGPSEQQLVMGSKRMCAGCRTARYCSKKCQTKHWKQHKVVCKAMAAAQQAETAGAAGQP